MSKYIADAYLQNPSAIPIDVTAIHMVSDSATPTGISNSLGSVAVDSGDWSWGDGDTSGRQLTLATQNITANADGQKRHIVGWTGSAVAFATPVTLASIVNAAIYKIPSIDVLEIQDPA